MAWGDRELVKKANARYSGSGNELMPPEWFLPRATSENQIDRAQHHGKRVSQHDVSYRPPALGERWLSSSVFTRLDQASVWVPITFVLGSMAFLHPALILGWLAPAVDGDIFGEAAATTLPVRLHALGSGCLWLGFLQLFLNLREVTRLRLSWLRKIMTQLGVSAKDFEQIGMSRADAEKAASKMDRSITRSVATEIIVNRCDQIERNDRAAKLCIAAEAAKEAGKDTVASLNLLRKAEALDPEAADKSQKRAKQRVQREGHIKAQHLWEQAAASEKAGEYALAREKSAAAEEMCPSATAEGGLTRQSTISRKVQSAEREVKQDNLRRMGMGGLPSGEEEFEEWKSCLDRPYVQMEIRWAWKYKKPIVVVFEKSTQRREYGFFDFDRARTKYAGSEWESVLNIDALEYMRDEDHAETMLDKILKKATDHHVPEAEQRQLNEPGRWEFFLSHAQATGGDQAQATYLRMKSRGKSCWYDNAMSDRSTEAMEEGVRCCGTFVLFLTSPNKGNWSEVSEREARQDEIVRRVTIWQAIYRGRTSRHLDSHSQTKLPAIFHELRRLYERDRATQAAITATPKTLPSKKVRIAQEFEHLQQCDGVDLPAAEEAEDEYVALSAAAKEDLQRFLSSKQDMIPPQHRLGRVRAARGYALSRLRWSSHLVADAISISGQRGRQEHALTTFSLEKFESLQAARLKVFGIAVALLSMLAGYIDVFFADAVESNALAYALTVYCGLGILLAVVVFTAWFLSLLLAVSLVTDAVDELREVAVAWSPARGTLSHGLHGVRAVHVGKAYRKGNWYEVMQRPCLELVNTVMPSLSQWAPAIGTAFATNWAFALLSVPLAVQEYNVTDNPFARRSYLAVALIVVATLPMLMLYAPATVSTSVVKLLDQLNELRVRSELTDADALARMDRAAHLYSYLRNLNNRHGPGFMVGTFVLDLAFLRQALVAVATVASTFVVYLSELGASEGGSSDSAGGS